MDLWDLAESRRRRKNSNWAHVSSFGFFSLLLDNSFAEIVQVYAMSQHCFLALQLDMQNNRSFKIISIVAPKGPFLCFPKNQISFPK